MDIVADAIELVVDTTASIFEAARTYLLAFLQAVVLLVFARLALGHLRGYAARLLARTEATSYAQAVIQQVLTVSVYFFVLSIILAIFGASWSGVLTFLTVTSIAVALSIQDVLKNLIAGLYILLERPFAPGETIRVKDVAGSVEHVSLRTTRLRSAEDELLIVPNAVLFSEIVLAPPHPVAERPVVDLTGIPEAPTEIARSVRDALACTPGLRPPGPRVQIRRLAGDCVDARVIAWHDPDEAIVPKALQRLRERFPESEIVVGGE